MVGWIGGGCKDWMPRNAECSRWIDLQSHDKIEFECINIYS